MPRGTFQGRLRLTEQGEVLAERYEAPRILIGHSLGGAAVVRAAAAIPSSRAVVTIVTPAEPAHVKPARKIKDKLKLQLFFCIIDLILR